MRQPQRQTVKITAIAFGVSLLSGCISLPDIPFIGDDEADEPELVEINTKSIENVDLFEAERNQQEIDKLRQEINELKPSINRMLALESDLQVILDTIDGASPPEIAFVDAAASSGETNPMALLGTQAQTPMPVLEMSRPAAVPDAVDVNPAPQMIQAATVVQASPQQMDTTTAATIDSKFSAAPASVPAPVVSQKTTTTTQYESRNIKSSTCSLPQNGQGFALHVASFTKRESAVSILQDMIPKMNGATECPLEGFIEVINVNSKQFYSARLGAFSDRSKATDACAVAKQFNDYCAVISNSGVKI